MVTKEGLIFKKLSALNFQAFLRRLSKSDKRLSTIDTLQTKLIIISFFVILSFCSDFSAFAQLAAAPAKPERNPQILSIISQAQLAQPELAADILIKVAGSKKVTDNSWRLELLEEALRTSENVKFRARRRTVPFRGVSVDTQSGYIGYAFDLKLDEYSLKARIINQLLAVDKVRARQIVFDLGNGLALSPLQCEDTLVYDVTDLYRTVAVAAKQLFSQKEIQNGSRAFFILPWIENIKSPSQVTPALALVAELQSPPIERRLLLGAILGLFEKDFNDDRSLTFELERNGLVSKVASITQLDPSLSSDLRARFRTFLKKNWSSRCEDHEVTEQGPMPQYIPAINSILENKPFSLEDLLDSEFKGLPKQKNYWESASSTQFQRAFREAQKKEVKTDGPMPEEDWIRKLSAFLDSIENWEPSGDETEADIFNQKWVFYNVLMERVPDGKFKLTVARRFLTFLNDAPIQRSSFIEWFVIVRRMFSEHPQEFVQVASEIPNPTFKLLIEESKAAR